MTQVASIKGRALRLWNQAALYAGGHPQSYSCAVLREGRHAFACVPCARRVRRCWPRVCRVGHQEPFRMAGLLAGAGHHVLGAIRGRTRLRPWLLQQQQDPQQCDW